MTYWLIYFCSDERITAGSYNVHYSFMIRGVAGFSYQLRQTMDLFWFASQPFLTPEKFIPWIVELLWSNSHANGRLQWGMSSIDGRSRKDDVTPFLLLTGLSSFTPHGPQNWDLSQDQKWLLGDKAKKILSCQPLLWNDHWIQTKIRLTIVLPLFLQILFCLLSKIIKKQLMKKWLQE